MFLLAELCFYWLKGSLVWLVKNSRRLELDRTLACTEGRESDDDDAGDHDNHLHSIGDNDHAGVRLHGNSDPEQLPGHNGDTIKKRS